MSNVDRNIGANAFNVRDCYVWSTIYYLDSSTDYREYLPQQGVRNVIGDDLVLLDPHGNFPWPQTRASQLFVLVVLTLLIGAFCYFLTLQL